LSCVAAIIFVEKENVITQSRAAAQRNLTNECNMPMKFNGKRILRIISLRWAQRISVINGKESALICEKRER